jgi:hypothetical protein
MTGHQTTAFVFQFIIGLGIAFLVYALLRRSLQELLHETVGIPAGTSFYLRSLLLILLFVALAKVINDLQVKPEAHFMEYVWAVDSRLSDIFENIFSVLLVYLGLITVLIAVLQRKNAK